MGGLKTGLNLYVFGRHSASDGYGKYTLFLFMSSITAAFLSNFLNLLSGMSVFHLTLWSRLTRIQILLSLFNACSRYESRLGLINTSFQFLFFLVGLWSSTTSNRKWLNGSEPAYEREGTGLNVPEKAVPNLVGMQATFAQRSVNTGKREAI